MVGQQYSFTMNDTPFTGEVAEVFRTPGGADGEVTIIMMSEHPPADGAQCSLPVGDGRTVSGFIERVMPYSGVFTFSLRTLFPPEDA